MRPIKFLKGGIYHIFNRGVEKRDIFKGDADRWRFIQALYLFNDQNASSNLLWKIEHEKGGLSFRTLREFLTETKQESKPLVNIMADCLMPNHFHLILKEVEENGISRFMHKIGTGYTNYFNKKYDRSGSFFQGTFKAVSVNEDMYLQYLLVYLNVINPGQIIEPNLKEEGAKDIDAIMDFAENYTWSTHQEYLGKRDSVIINKGELGELFSDAAKYKEFAKDVLLSKKYSEISNLILEE